VATQPDHQTVISHVGDDRAQVARLDNEGAAPVEAFLVFEMPADPDRGRLGERGDQAMEPWNTN
jgi:hypothetical protein